MADDHGTGNGLLRPTPSPLVNVDVGARRCRLRRTRIEDIVDGVIGLSGTSLEPEAAFAAGALNECSHGSPEFLMRVTAFREIAVWADGGDPIWTPTGLVRGNRMTPCFFPIAKYFCVPVMRPWCC